MNVFIIRHTATADLSLFEQWAKKSDHSLTILNVCEESSFEFPALEDVDALITTGGPQCAPLIDRYPELMHEIKFLTQVIEAKKPILGICLGGQLLGHAFGAAAARSPEPEFGYYPLTLTKEGENDPLFKSLSNPFDSLHWHQDMIGVPVDAVILAKSRGCPVQAVKFCENAYALQFHWDFTRSMVIKYLQKMEDHMPIGSYVQHADEMLLADFSYMKKKLYALLDSFTSLR